MPCICGHEHDKHISGRDYGYHNYSCSVECCSCTAYYAVRTFRQHRKKGLFQDGNSIRMYERYISTVERNDI